MARKPVQLDPRVQQQILEQMREEQAASIRSNQIMNYVMIPGILALTMVGIVMAFSDDKGIALVGNMFASSILTLVWKLRKRIGAKFE